MYSEETSKNVNNSIAIRLLYFVYFYKTKFFHIKGDKND